MMRLRRAIPLGVIALLLSPVPAGLAADHGDSPLMTTVGRHDARLTDLHVFTVGDRLVLSLCSNPAIPPGVTEYRFASDLTLRIHVDNHSEVSFADPADNATFGGKILDPRHVGEDIRLELTFGDDGAPRLRLDGLPASARSEIRVFAGLRDDPFIRGPRIGRNVAAIVVEMPLALALGHGDTILVWGTSKIPEVRGPISEHAGRALRSMFAAEDALNTSTPRAQFMEYGMRPDVVIFDTSRPAAFPNGRALADDVVDLVGEAGTLASDAPSPSENDVPFLPDFPYLAPPR